MRYFCQRVVLMSDGRIVEDRPVDQALAFEHPVGQQLQRAMLPERPEQRLPAVQPATAQA
ncbi:nickel transporter ATP-binding protein NikE [compost metagenome]